MSRNQRNYLVASIYYLVGNVIGQGVVLLSSIIFTRLMSKADYGLVSTYNSWVLILNTFIGLNLFVSVRNAYIDYSKNYKAFCSSVLVFSLISSAGFSIIIIVGCKLFNANMPIIVVALAIIQAISVHAVNYISAIYSMENKYKARTAFMVLPNVVHTVLSIVLVYVLCDNQYLGKILGNSVGMAIFALIVIYIVFREKSPSLLNAGEYWKYAGVIAIPGIAYTLADLLLMQSDRIMLTSLSGAEETAIYSVVYNVGSILIALYTAINGSWTPWFYKKLAVNEINRIKEVQRYYVLIFVGVSVCLLFVSPEIIKILAPKEYWSGIVYVNLIIMASFLIFLYSFFTTYLMYSKKVGIIAINTIIAASVNIIMNRVLISEYRAVGAAYATIISYILLFILNFLAVKRENKDIFDKKSFGIGVILIILSSIFYQGVYECFLIRWIFVVVILGGFVIFILKNRSLLRNIRE